MSFTYSLDQNDFLQYQLFLASKTDRIKKQRIKSWLIVTGCMLLLSFMFHQSNNQFLFYYFLIFGILTFIFYPFYQRQKYKKHYARFIAENYKNKFGQTANLKFTEFAIEANDISGETKINLTELENVTETADYFYPKLKGGTGFIIPKSKIADVDHLRTELSNLCGKLNISFVQDLNWRWK